MNTDPAAEIARRRTFAIISHPDAGKTTLTERLLRAGGAIQLAGNVRAKGERRRTRSDWMGIERERGISVVTSVMTFEHAGCVFNLLDTPGHEDFSEDTYRTLTAVDSAVMVIDAAKGIEARTRKLFEICRLRDIPILTFINKMDREARDPFELLDEVSSTLALDTAPVTWPVGRASEFVGTYDLRTPRLSAYAKTVAVRSAHAGARRGGRPGARGAARVRGRAVRRRPPHAGLFRQRHPRDRRSGPARRARRVRPASTRAAGRYAGGGSDRARPDRAGVQDPGEHGPQPPRPHRLRPRLLRAPHARDALAPGADGKTHPAARAAVLLRPRARAGRRGVRRRRGRHPQPRHAAHRRHVDRGRGCEFRRRAPISPRKSCAGCGSTTR